MEDPAQSQPEAPPASSGHETGPGAAPVQGELRRLVQEEVTRQIAAAGRTSGAPADSGVAAMAGFVGIAEMARLMPPGLRSESTVRRLIFLRVIPAVKIRSRWCLRPAEVAAALLKQEHARERTHQFLESWKETKTSWKRVWKKGFGSQKIQFGK
jgi:hypothetical protein